jgi:two-component system, NarL family, invasion response regulator UvrY
MIRVLICDDHTIVREGLKEILAGTQDIVGVGEASSGEELLDKVEGGDFDVVLLDISLPGANGLEVLKRLQVSRPELPVLFLTMYPETHYAVRAMRAGAAGYLTKGSATTQLIGAIRKVASGGRYVSETLAEQLALELLEQRGRPAREALSDREYEVMQALARGSTVTEIGEDLHLSVKTISTYRTRILNKLGLKNNAEIVHYALREGIIQ